MSSDSIPPDGQNETNLPYERGIYDGNNDDPYDFSPTQGGSAGAFAREKVYKVKFEHVATRHSVEFPCIVESLSDTHDAELSEQVFMGRMDPLVQQTSTGRKISFTFKILNASVEEARYNAVSINMLLQMMYPRLQSNGNIEAGSFIRIHGVPYLKEEATKNYQTCLISNISYDLNVDEGFITPDKYELYPISISINIEGQAILPISLGSVSHGWENPYPETYPSYINPAAIHSAEARTRAAAEESENHEQAYEDRNQDRQGQEEDPAMRHREDRGTVSEED